MMDSRVSFVLVLLMCLINGEERNEDATNFEYKQIFSRMPVLFEYLIARLHERPEILEKDDINLFEKNLSEHLGQHSNTNKNEDKKNIINEESSFLAKVAKAKEINNNAQITKFISAHLAENNRKDLQKNYDIPGKHKTKELSDFGESFLGHESVFALDFTPEDIVERVKMAEKWFEDYLNRKNEDNSC